MHKQLDYLKDMSQLQFFGVCSFIGDTWGIPLDRIRIVFVYVSLFSYGSSVPLYLIAAFWLHIRQYVKRSRCLVE
jgi:phage shock protein PspC (stress-responsive transcriptional regulator)